MAGDRTTLHGPGWTAWFSEPKAQWVLKYRVKKGIWRMHRVPHEIQSDQDAARYCRAFVKTKREKPTPTAAAPNGTISKDMTLKQLGELWTSGKLAKIFPRYVKPKKSANDDAARLRRYVYEHIGDIPIKEFAPPKGLELAERVMAGLPPPEDFSDASARQVAQAVHRVLGLAVYPLRLLEVHPLPRGFMPKPAHDKAKTYIYPDEDLKLMRCTEVPVVERLFYGFLAREGARVGEVRGVQLYEFDLVHGWGHLDETKNGRPKDWPLQAGTIEALKRYRDRYMKSKGPHALVFAKDDGSLLDPYALAENLRTYLKLAKVRRPQLYLKSKRRLALRTHDLRASFVTVALANGKTESWVGDRTGHMSSVMIMRYKRWARGHAEQDLGDWTPLHIAIPELADKTDQPRGHEPERAESHEVAERADAS